MPGVNFNPVRPATMVRFGEHECDDLPFPMLGSSTPPTTKLKLLSQQEEKLLTPKEYREAIGRLLPRALEIVSAVLTKNPPKDNPSSDELKAAICVMNANTRLSTSA
jgi:hypothetical protein